MLARTPESGNQASFTHVRSAQISHWKVELLPRAPYEVRYTPEQPTIGYSFECQEGMHAFASDRKKEFRASANGLAWVPAGCEVYSQSEGGEYLKIYCVDGQYGKSGTQQHFSDIIDQSAIQSAFALRRALLSENQIDLLLCESWLLALESCVTQVLMATENPVQRNCWMDTHRLKKIDETIEERLDTKLTVSELAGESGISAGFFSREFKRATGRSPHQYIVDKRLARARQKLLNSKQDLSAIAFDCGFSSHSHMTSHFRERFNTTPGKLYRDV